MKWSQAEIEMLSPILRRVQSDVEPREGKSILVLCSAAGDFAFVLGESMTHGQVIGLEFSEELHEASLRLKKRRALKGIVEFQRADKERIRFPDAMFDVLVSEFIVYPTPSPTEIGQREMARVLKAGGRMMLTDVIVTKPIPKQLRAELKTIGLDYLCEATQDDFRDWMTNAGLVDVEVTDFTSVVRKVWEHRRASDKSLERRKGYSLLLEHPEFQLGKAIFYIYVQGKKRF